MAALYTEHFNGGWPLAVVLSDANTHDVKLLEETPDHIMTFHTESDEARRWIVEVTHSFFNRFRKLLRGFRSDIGHRNPSNKQKSGFFTLAKAREIISQFYYNYNIICLEFLAEKTDSSYKFCIGGMNINCEGIDVSKGKRMIAVIRPSGELAIPPFEAGHERY